MARYELLAAAFIRPIGYAGPVRLDAGAVIDFEGTPNRHMRPLDAEARAALEAEQARRGFVVTANGVQVERSGS